MTGRKSVITYYVEMVRSQAVCHYLVGRSKPLTKTTASFVVYLYSHAWLQTN